MIKKEEIKKQIQTIRSHSLNEYRETLHLLRLLKKRAKSREDIAFIRHQSVDIMKIIIVLAIGALPGGTVVIAFIEMGFRKIDRTILPTAFTDEIQHKIDEYKDKTVEHKTS